MNMPRKGMKHLTEKDRYTLEYMVKSGMKVADIAKELGHSRSTIYRELKRGMVKQVTTELVEVTRYFADVAQRDYDCQKKEKGRYLKVGNDMEFIRFVEQKIGKERYSPVATLLFMKANTNIRTKICHRTLYRYIHSGVFLNLTSKDLPYKVSKKREKQRKNIALRKSRGRSIEERPSDIKERLEFGDWEMDTVYGGRGKSLDCLLVLTERKTRYEEIYHMKSRTQNEVIRVLNDLERKHGFIGFFKRYRTITCDNGSEFLNMDDIENSVIENNKKRTMLYFCHPFCSSERGSNENQNKLIRRWIPKGDDISLYIEQIPYIQDWINNYPRQMFGGMSSIQYMSTL